MKRFLRSAAVVFAVLMVLSWLSPVQADVAPPPVPIGTNISPDQEQTQVRMVSEKVVIEVAAQSPNDAGQAYVTASFHMRNLGSTTERMQVRFPLCSGYGGVENMGCIVNSPIQDFGVRVNGNPQIVENTFEQIIFPDGSKAELPTWANFPVSFPPGKDVNILIRYTQPGYDRSGPAHSEYTYILYTGAGWKDTIGTADILVRLPMKASEETVYLPESEYSNEPGRAVLEGQEIRFHFEEFEPHGDMGTISVTVLQPKVWQKMEAEKKNVAAHPNDGEAWGRLGKAYKTAVLMEKGHIRLGNVGKAWYCQGVEAYQKAVDLLPQDADWHYGFADLLASNLSFNQYSCNGEDEQSLEVQLVQQIKQALDINPKHAGAMELLKMVAKPGVVDLRGDQPVYSILTATPTRTKEPTIETITEIPTSTRRPAITLSPTFTATRPQATHAMATATVFVTPTSVQEMGKAKTPGICGAAIIPALFAAVVLLLKMRL